MWKKLSLSALGLIVVVAGLALYIFREDLYEFSINPRVPFQVTVPAPEPDYSKPKNWAAWPGKTPPKNVDVFYIHTTTYLKGKVWNGSLQGDERERVEKYLIPGQAVIFSDIGNLYAPLYRQATLYSFLTRSLDSSRARVLAYGDVARAFQYFLKHRQPNRPFILVGHGQGALHGVRLLSDFVDHNSDVRKHLVAAYLAGAAVPLSLFDSHLKNIKPCDQPQETGCVAAWTAFFDVPEAKEFLGHALYWAGEELLPAQDKDLLCVNPLTWTVDERVANASLNKGAVPIIKGKKGPLGPVLPHLSGAQCQSGLLFTDRPSRRMAWPQVFRGDRPDHLIDFNLFFYNIRDNAAARVGAYFKANGGPRQST